MQDTVARAPKISVAEALHFRTFEYDSSHSYRYPGALRRLFDFDQKRDIFTLLFVYSFLQWILSTFRKAYII